MVKPIFKQPMSTPAPVQKETKTTNKRTKQTIANLTKQENLLQRQQLQNQPPLQQHQFNSTTPLTTTNNANNNTLAPQAVSLMPMTTLTLTNATQTNFVEPKKEPKVSPNTQLQNKRNSKLKPFYLNKRLHFLKFLSILIKKNNRDYSTHLLESL
jgi:hypothetical protein